jgi:hypothetical protein
MHIILRYRNDRRLYHISLLFEVTYYDKYDPFAGQRFGKHPLKARIATEEEVHFIDNSSRACIPMTTGEWQLIVRCGGLYSVLLKLQKRVHSWIHSFVREFKRQLSSWVFSCGVSTSGQRKQMKWPSRKSEPSQSCRMEDTCSPVRNRASLRQSLIVRCRNWL